MATVTQTDNMPLWVVNMAREYADRNGLATISVNDFFRTSEYRAIVRRNDAGVRRIADADIRATGGQFDSLIHDNTPRHKGD